MSAILHRDTVPAFVAPPRDPRRRAVQDTPARQRLMARLEQCHFDSAEAQLIGRLLDLDPFLDDELSAAFSALEAGAAGFPDPKSHMSVLMSSLDADRQSALLYELEAMATEAELLSWTE